MLDWLADPLMYGFMQRGLAGFYDGWHSLLGHRLLRCFTLHGLSSEMPWHMLSFQGVAIAYLLGGNLLLGALIAAILVALGIGYFSRQGTLREDTAIGILFAAALSLGVVLISSIKTYAVDLTHILFGNILGVRTAIYG
jgi:manganese/iron transport system permease protein